MQKKIASILFSTRLMAILFLVFAVALGLGTFIEDWYSTETARVLIYNTFWFELIMFIFVINFLGNIQRYQLYKREKWSSLMLHLAFIFILVGAFITRYISYEGMMPIREGATENTFLSSDNYFTAFIDGEIEGKALRREYQKKVMLAPGTSNSYTFRTDYNGQKIKFETVDYIHGAVEGLVESPDGENFLKLVEAGGGNRHDHFLKEGEVSNIHNVLFAFNKPTEGAVNIGYKDGDYTISSPFEGDYMTMADQSQGQVAKDSTQALQLRSLYNLAGMQFVIPEPIVKGNYDLVPTEDKEGAQDAVRIRVTTDGKSEVVSLLGGIGRINDPKKISLGGLDFYLRFGSKQYELPFSIKLNDFIAAKYPGTEKTYSSFKSKVEVIDDGKSEPYEIYMNHVLDKGGYRFFQASFDPDEKGTHLSVNHDFWGTWVTYVGYFFLFFGLIWTLFAKGSRFGELRRMLDKIEKKKSKYATVILLLLMSSIGFSQEQNQDPDHEHVNVGTSLSKQEIDSIIKENVVSPKHAAKFGELIIQDYGGRMKPANTYSSELLRKLSKSATYEGLTSDQIMISIVENPTFWYNVPILKVKRGNDSIRHIAGVSESTTYFALTDFFDKEGNYKLSPFLEKAYQAAVPNQFQKDFIETDRRVNLLYQALQGKILRIFPIPNDENNKWVSYPEAAEANFKGMDSVYTQQIIPIYMNTLQSAKESGDYSKADDLLESIKNFQRKYGGEVIPSKSKVHAEILYNKYDVFRNLFWLYMLAGIVMLMFVIFQIFNNNKLIRNLILVSKIVVIALFVLHTAGLLARWYISGHAPWSDAYESVIYVAWATMLFGIIFGRKSDLTLASTAFVTSMILMIAHWNWMDPAIANLEPVLDSYWLMIHVSIIVGSYGPFTLGMILGAVALILMILTTSKNKKKMDLTIKEITIVTEMALTVGLVMLIIGNFLGGQWANESWGRYWGWDPKETWALVSIMVYAFVIHMRIVPGMRSRWLFNFIAVVAFSSIMMTYFGVNFYLSGLHSYASGDKVITPNFVYYTLVIVAILGVASYLSFMKHYKKGNRNRLTSKFLRKKNKKKR